MSRSRWFFPGDTQLDRARTVARACWKALHTVDPRGAAALAATFAGAGETWLTGRRDTTSPAGWLTREQVAELGDVQPNAVTMWASRGIRRGGIDVKLTRYPEGYDEAEVMDFIALTRTPAPRTKETP